MIMVAILGIAHFSLLLNNCPGTLHVKLSMLRSRFPEFGRPFHQFSIGLLAHVDILLNKFTSVHCNARVPMGPGNPGKILENALLGFQAWKSLNKLSLCLFMKISWIGPGKYLEP